MAGKNFQTLLRPAITGKFTTKRRATCVIVDEYNLRKYRIIRSSILSQCFEQTTNQDVPLTSSLVKILWFKPRGGIGGTVASKSALRSAGTLLSRFELRPRRPGLTEGPKA
ncbi:hypothetical protein PoB_001346100 [Plakobranchus ocellatus]|uniref:Uncharacterized protein n=1 Tax=Plakobranchus ocellatus TaxID=259542 RepID=A0AAV3YU36_9GAST|nr:hypothetical protein PoB_001346100 [Plakobranchus ocellatus]